MALGWQLGGTSFFFRTMRLKGLFDYRVLEAAYAEGEPSFSPDSEYAAFSQHIVRVDEEQAEVSFKVPIVSVENAEVVSTLSVEETEFSIQSERAADIHTRVAIAAKAEVVVLSTSHKAQHINYLWEKDKSGQHFQKWRVVGEDCSALVFSSDEEFILCAQNKLNTSNGQVDPLTQQEQSLTTSLLPTQSATIPIDQTETLSIPSPDGSSELVLAKASGATNATDQIGIEIPGKATIKLEHPKRGLRLRISDRIVISPNGEKIALIEAGNGVVAWNREGTFINQFSLEKYPKEVAWSPDGQTIVINGISRVLFISVP
ncbi:MAG: hypothetical protein AAFZ17_03855 [Cyanobacteria bacterium J06650_10]